MLRTMLAATITREQINQELFALGPMIVQPKYDGVRLQYYKGNCYTGRNGKELRNTYITNVLRKELGCRGVHLDGELLALGVDGNYLPMHDVISIRGTESIAMTQSDEKVSFRYVCFDDLFSPGSPYKVRIQNIPNTFHVSRIVWKAFFEHNKFLDSTIDQMMQLESQEGIIFRLYDGRYKEGRSTFRERLLLKYKPFTDLDVTIIGYERLFSNTNAPTINLSTGLTERSKSMAGMVPCERLGAFICTAAGFSEPFNVGTGFTEDERRAFWLTRDYMIGRTATIKYQVSGTKHAPRSPVWLRLRQID